MAQTDSRGQLIEFGYLTLQECAELARVHYSGISEMLGAGPLPTGFPDVQYKVVDHGEFDEHTLPRSINPFRLSPRPVTLADDVDVWSVRRSPDDIRWHAARTSFAVCQRTRQAAVEHALASLAFGVCFWAEKLRWHRRGDRTDWDVQVVRRNGRHGAGGWYQGEIPAELRPLLPDNAELFTPEVTR